MVTFGFSFIYLSTICFKYCSLSPEPEYCANVIVTGLFEVSEAAVLSVEAASEELAVVLAGKAVELQALSASIAAIKHAM